MRRYVRILIILSACLAASLAAGCVYSVVLAFPIEPFGLLNRRSLKGFAATAVIIGGFAAVFGVLPALPGIIVAERTGVRSFWFYGLGGALTGILAYALCVVVLAWGAGSDNKWSVLAEIITVDRADAWIISAAAGLAAGLVDWLIAGRNAGIWPPAASRPGTGAMR